MTYKQKLQIEHPDRVDSHWCGGCFLCPGYYGYCEPTDGLCHKEKCTASETICTRCWNREIPGTEPSEEAEEPEWRVVDRPPVVGDYIRLKTNGLFSFNEPGDILRIDEVYRHGLVGVYGKHHLRETHFDDFLWNYRSHEYEVVERVPKEESNPIDTTAPDVVNHPSHYETARFECIDVMIETQGVEAVKHFCLCNAFKYLYRHNRKNGLEDIRKAQWYINKYIELEEQK